MGGELIPTHAGMLATTEAKHPAQILEEARQKAVLLKSMISQQTKDKEWVVSIAGREHLKLEAWTTMAQFYGCTVRTRSTEYVEFGGARGFQSVAEVVNNLTGQIIGTADAMCLDDEENWDMRPQYEWVNNQRKKVGEKKVPLAQIRSMAQTRASSKALRLVFSWVVVLAGYHPTGAEEMMGAPPVQDKPPMSTPRRKSEVASAPTSPADGDVDKHAAVQPPKCEKCKVDCVYKLAGIKRSGKSKGDPYPAFWSCPNYQDCNFKPITAKDWYEQQQAGKKEPAGQPSMSAEDVAAKVDELYTNIVNSSQRSLEALNGYLGNMLYGRYEVTIKEADLPKVLEHLEALTAKVPTEQSQILGEYEPGASKGLAF